MLTSKTVTIKRPTKAPIIKMPPCAMLMIFKTPNTSVKPIASTAYKLPRVNPLTNCCKNTILPQLFIFLMRQIDRF